MGASFTNYQVRGKSANEVSEAAAKLVTSRAYVSPEKNGWVTVYDEASDSQDDKIITGIAASLSKTLKASVIAFLVHHSDIAVYWLYQNGTLVDEFNSAPDYFKEVSETEKLRVRGDTDELLPFCVAGTTREQIEEVIHPSDGFPTFAEYILVNLAKLLGIDDVWMGLGFTYFEDEGEEVVPEASEFKSIGKETALAFDMFPMAIGMMTKCWNGEQEKMAQAFSERFPNQNKDSIAKQFCAGFDQIVRGFLKESRLPDRPTFEEIKAARDQGPKILAQLLVKRAPTQLGSIAEGAIQEGLESFFVALLESGMNPNTPTQHGQSLIEVAEYCGKQDIVRLLKSALEKKS